MNHLRYLGVHFDRYGCKLIAAKVIEQCHFFMLHHWWNAVFSVSVGHSLSIMV